MRVAVMVMSPFRQRDEMNSMLRILRVSALVTFACAFAAIAVKAAIGSHLAPDGTLIEPFFLLPIGFLFLFVGIVASVAYGIVAIVQRMRPTAERERAER